MKKILFLFTIVLFLPNHFYAQTAADAVAMFAKSYDYMNDFEKILTPSQVKTLNDFLKSSEAKTSSKILIVTTPSIAPYTDLSDYSLALDKYMLSQLKIDTSILIVISKQLRQIQVQGVEKVRSKMSDQELKDIITSYVVPELKKGDYYKGLELGVKQLLKKIE
ncbi:TPM domain-containing protein [Flavobacterium quisquiliarum]|uniref:TPM domain-containing protein n=1 Tax=Flavobacterium quisquiliarum TaxID=1834436 RepID=A0ABV8W781_9FLAO|nr:TPM domain-containing protein [Flavobacterium quisquiliarum]MBW1654197.1 TPM domain-containing protein [Flavobacterium quisquiliarum]NWL00810.1 TPM domain-containing protein [Flavobacterium collinsii]